MVTFWILAPDHGRAALGILFGRKAVHAALLLAVVMIGLAAAVPGAARAVPVRGADHRLHRRDPDAVPVRADAGRRRRVRLGRRDDQGGSGWMANVVGLLFGVLLVFGVGAGLRSALVTGLAAANAEGNVPGLARLLFPVRLRVRGRPARC